MRFTIWKQGLIYGTYPGATEAEALDAFAKEQGYVDFADANAKQNLTRDDYKVKQA